MGRALIFALLLTVAAYVQATTTAPHLSERDPNWGSVVRVEGYKAVANISYGDTSGRDLFLPACANTVDPRPMDTPNPMLSDGSDILVSFVIGTDGRVYSMFTLVGDEHDPNVRVMFRVVEKWRFRPGTCNEVPTNSEGVVLFKRQ